MNDDKPSNGSGAVVFTLSKRALVVAGAAALLVLIGLAILVGVLLVRPSAAAAPQTTATPLADTQPVQPPSATVEPAPVVVAPAPTPANPTFGIGQQASSYGVGITVKSVKVMDSVPTTSGGVIAADPGTELVYFEATFTNHTSTAVDLTCGNAAAVFMHVYDTQGNELAPMFKEPDIAGNPVCNDHLVQGQSHDWNFLYKAPAGSVPASVNFLDVSSPAHRPGDNDFTIIRLQ